MSEMRVVYEGKLRSRVTHINSATTMIVDGPARLGGWGESFSPTDLLASSLATCMLMMMETAALGRGWSLGATRARIIKTMSAKPPSRIESIAVEFEIPEVLTLDQRAMLKRAAAACPVHRSLKPEVKTPITFRWGGSKEIDQLNEH